MSASADIADRDEQMLARLAELDLAAAERVHERLMAAEAADEVAISAAPTSGWRARCARPWR